VFYNTVLSLYCFYLRNEFGILMILEIVESYVIMENLFTNLIFI